MRTNTKFFRQPEWTGRHSTLVIFILPHLTGPKTIDQYSDKPGMASTPDRPSHLAATGVIFSASDSSGEGRTTGFVSGLGFAPQYPSLISLASESSLFSTKRGFRRPP